MKYSGEVPKNLPSRSAVVGVMLRLPLSISDTWVGVKPVSFANRYGVIPISSRKSSFKRIPGCGLGSKSWLFILVIVLLLLGIVIVDFDIVSITRLWSLDIGIRLAFNPFEAYPPFVV